MSPNLPAYAEQFRQSLLSWGRENRRLYSWRDDSRTLYEVFVAEFLLTQTPADNVADVYPAFLERFPSLKDLNDADPEEIEATIEPLGFQRMRTEALDEIAEEYDTLPRDRERLLTLTRVGPYVADATLCFALERPLPILDRNVVRVYDRLFGSAFPEKTSERRELAVQLVPDDGDRARRYNLALLDFGALVCQKREPKCETCFASDYCRYYNSQEES